MRRYLFVGSLMLLAAAIGRLSSTGVVLGQSSGEGKTVTVESLRVVDKSGKLRAQLGVSEDGKTGLDLLDKDGKIRVKLLLTDNGTPSLGYYTPDGKIYSSCSCLWK